MELFKYLEAVKLNQEHFNSSVEFLIDDFLPKKLITMYYADGGNGKSYLASAVVKHLLEQRKVQRAFYVDFDNPLSVLKGRKVDSQLIAKYTNLNYLQRSNISLSPLEFLLKIEESAVGNSLTDTLFVFDSLRNLCDITNDTKTMRAMEALMNIREAGATVLLLHHSNKDGKNYQGSNNIRNSIDCMYRLTKRPSKADEINFLLEVQKERAGIKDSSFCVKLDSLKLEKSDLLIATMNEYEIEFVQKAQKLLSVKPLNKTDLLEGIGYKKDDKHARECLEKFEDKLWIAKREGKSYIYSLK